MNQPELAATTVLLRVADLDRAAAYYATTLGLREESRQPGLVFFHAGPIRIGLNQLPSEAPRGEEKSLLGYTEVVLETPDIAGAMATLKARGVAFLAGDKPIHVAALPDCDLYAAPFRDPDGHVLSLLSRVWKTTR